MKRKINPKLTVRNKIILNNYCITGNTMEKYQEKLSERIGKVRQRE